MTIYKGNNFHERRQINEALDSITADVSALKAAPVVVGSATSAFSAELVATAGTNTTVTVGSGTLTIGAGYPIFVQGLEIALPSGGTVQYFGQFPRVPSTTSAVSRVYIPKNGTIKRADISAWIKTAGSNEAWTLAIRLNDTTDTTIASVGSSTNLCRFTNTGLSIAVTTSDYVEIKMTFPSWVTPPEGVVMAGMLHVE